MATAKRKPGSKKRRMGRPTKYRETHRTVVEQAAHPHAPLTDKDIADLFGVNEQTVKNWYGQYPDFLASVKKAKAVTDDHVERSLFERATGYSVPDVHFTATGQKIPVIKHYPPEVVACIFWLKNRRPKQWQESQTQRIDATMALNVRIISFAEAGGGDQGDQPEATDEREP